MSSVTCMSCRLRRKKCDKRVPACSRCERLEVPCVYKDGVGLQEKDSHRTFEQTYQRNQQLRAEVQDLTERLRNARLCQDHTLDEHMSLAPSTASFTPEHTPVSLTTIELLTQERKKYLSQIQSKASQTPCLQVFEQRCTAAAAGLDIREDGEFVVLQMLGEMLSLVVPPVSQYYEWIAIFRDHIRCRPIVLGMAPVSEDLLDAFTNVVAFDRHGLPYLNFDLYARGDSLIHVTLLLLAFAICFFIRSRRRLIPEHTIPTTWNYTLCIRYATAVLNTDLLNTKIRIGDTHAQNTELTIAMFQLHVYTRYSVTTSLVSQNSRSHEIALATGHLISRCRHQHFHEHDLKKYYPDLTFEQENSFRSVWYALAVIDIIESLEMGITTRIRSEELSPLRSTMQHQVGHTIAGIHDVVQLLSSLDPQKVDIDKLVEIVTACSADLIKIYQGFEKTPEEDFDTMRQFKGTQPGTPLGEYYKCCERIFLRCVLFATLRSAYTIVSGCLERLGETIGKSDRALVMRLLATKYASLCLEYTRQLKRFSKEVGDDPNNPAGHSGIIACWHFLTLVESVTSKQSMIYLAALARQFITTDIAEIREFVRCHRDDIELEKAILKKINEKGTVEAGPTFSELVDFSLDSDPPKLIKVLGKLIDPRVQFKYFSEMFIDIRESSNTAAVNFGFMKLTDNYALGTRYTCVGLRYFFPESAPRMANTRHNDRKTEVQKNQAIIDLEKAMERWNIGKDKSDGASPIEFGGTFRELFEQEIDTRLTNQIDFGQFLHDLNSEELLREGFWEAGFIGTSAHIDL